MAKISVIIPSFKRPQELARLLESLSQQVMSPNEFEVLVVGNYFEKRCEKTAHLYSKKLTISYSYTGVIGVNAARNLGVRKAKNEILLFLDDDCVVSQADYLNQIWQLHQKYHEASIIGGRYSLPSNSGVFAQAYHYNADFWLTKAKITSTSTRQVIGGNMSAKAKIFANRIRFNENIKFGGSETELNTRLVKSGHQLLLLDKLKVEHITRLGPFEYCQRAFKQGQGRYREELLGAEVFNINESEIDIDGLNKMGSNFRVILVACLLYIYGYFFRAGYRHSNHFHGARGTTLSTFKALIAELVTSENQSKISTQHLTETPYHRSKRPIFRFKAYYHKLKAHSWKLAWLFKRPYHWSKLHLWKVPFHLCQKPFYFLRENFLKLWIPVKNFIRWKVLGLLKCAYVLIYFKIYQFLRWQIIARLNHHWKVHIYNFLKYNIWYGFIVLHIVGNLWRLKVTIFWPIFKPFWMLEYQLSKTERFRVFFGKFSASEFVRESQIKNNKRTLQKT